MVSYYNTPVVVGGLFSFAEITSEKLANLSPLAILFM